MAPAAAPPPLRHTAPTALSSVIVMHVTHIPLSVEELSTSNDFSLILRNKLR